MRPALQRLLSRPSSLELLRCLVGTPGPTLCVTRAARDGKLGKKRVGGNRGYGGVALASRDVDLGHLEVDSIPDEPQGNGNLEKRESLEARRQRSAALKSSGIDSHPIQNSNQALDPLSQSLTIIREPRSGHGIQRWHEGLWTHEQLEFESDLESELGAGKRLLDQDEFRHDMQLWACLLSYRRRIYGDSGTISFWNAIRARSLVLPTPSKWNPKSTSMLWPVFLDLGFKNHAILQQIVDYADDLWKHHKKRWTKLHVSVVGHFLRSGDGENALGWHRRLLPNHPPGKAYFARMCREVTIFNGDMKSLKKIYRDLPYRNAYSRVIPNLIAKERFKDAYHWHLFFIENGDLPTTSKMVEPLMHHLAIYDRLAAVKVSKSLVDSGVSFASSLPVDMDVHTKISREMVNLIHGKTFNVSEKKYNDSLGSRWFATSWISLDIAINAVHALGVQEIGPLSFLAICLRDPNPQAIVLRIQQLRDLGISIGNSLFTRAIERFARNRQTEFLEGLLYSDQHPDQLEDRKLQENILLESSRLQDWRRYDRTLEILSLVGNSPHIERENIILRSLITAGDATAAREYLNHMQIEGIPVKAKTCSHILRGILRARRQGRRPMVPFKQATKGEDDLDKAIEILRSIMTSGSYVPATLWREIIRRLGMLGRLDGLRELCLFLAHWYGPSSPRRDKAFRVPLDVPSSHPLHPLTFLFNKSLQHAIVEWGFIHSLAQDHRHRNENSKGLKLDEPIPFPDVSFGISLLKQLHAQGVHIDTQSVRKALLHRLIVYYGPGTSNKPYNRIGQARMRGQLEVVAKQIDEALGGDFFAAVDLPRLVAELGLSKLEALERRKRRRLSAPE